MPFTVHTQPSGYGLFWAYLTVNGVTFTAGGYGEKRAVNNAWAKAFAAGVKP